jgi:hypothetical protein
MYTQDTVSINAENLVQPHSGIPYKDLTEAQLQDREVYELEYQRLFRIDYAVDFKQHAFETANRLVQCACHEPTGDDDSEYYSLVFNTMEDLHAAFTHVMAIYESLPDPDGDDEADEEG